jgi:hypothetical protein
MAHLPAESGPEREENKDKPKSNHFFSAKALHRPTLEAQRRSPAEMGQFGPSWGAATPRERPLPFLARSGPNFTSCLLPSLQTLVACASWKTWYEGWQFSQDREACKEAQLHSISTIHLMMVWGLWCRGTRITDMAHWVASPPLNL